MLARARLLFAVSASLCAGAVNLPVYIEDSHAGTFYWAIRNLPLNRDIQLVLIDAHSDASEVFNSDAIRQRVLQARSADDIDELTRKWRARGVIQSYNWIEPLVPHPVSKVWWVPGRPRTPREAIQQINAYETTSPRAEGDLSGRYSITDLNRLMKQVEGPVVASIDLDYFSGERRANVAGLLDAVLRLRDLQAITIAISRPYLASDGEGHQLLFEALNYLMRVVNVDIRFEPYATTGEDRSDKAKSLYRRGLDVPAYDIADAPGLLRSLLLRNAARIEVDEHRDRWERLLDQWRNDSAVPRITMAGGEDHLVRAGEPFHISVLNSVGRVRWKVLVPAHEKYNLTNEEEGFAAGASKFLLFDERIVPAADGLTELDDTMLQPFFDRKTGWGTIRVFCEASAGRQTYSSNVMRLSRYKGDGYLGKLTEIFNLPYVYGSAMLQEDGKTSADARYGADCSNFIIYGLRREGRNIPYVNPKDLLRYLVEVDEFSGFRDGVAFGRQGPIRLESGLLLHFGSHVAAVFEDTGILNQQTQVVHQLETYPAITTFGAMARKYKRIRIMHP